MNNESLEDKYRKVLRQRISLEGDLAALRQQTAERLKLSEKKSKKYLLILLFTPFCLLFFQYRKTHATLLQNQLTLKKDSLDLLQQKIQVLENCKAKRVVYVTQSGDNLAHLGELFYNDSLSGKQIDTDNHLNMPSLQKTMLAGDTVYIYYR